MWYGRWRDACSTSKLQLPLDEKLHLINEVVLINLERRFTDNYELAWMAPADLLLSVRLCG